MEVALLDLILFAHVIGAIVLVGTGTGIAWFMTRAHATDDPLIIAHTAAMVVRADTIFTLPAVLLQPVTGLALAINTGWPVLTGWVFVSILLYVLIGLFWLPVVVIQARMRDLADMAVEEETPLPSAYYSLYRIWFACGVPAFTAIIVIVWLMLMKPDIAFGIPV